jgi:hypothetical protein
MRGYITLHHFMSGDTVHIKFDSIAHIRESKKAVVIVTLDGRGMYVSESMDEIAFLMNV